MYNDPENGAFCTQRRLFMAKKTQTDKKNDALDALKNDISAGSPRNLYIFHGAERYLLEHYIVKLPHTFMPRRVERLQLQTLRG